MYDKKLIEDSKQTDLGIVHHFSDGVYAKQMHLPKGHVAVSHKHEFSHLSILSCGKCVVETDLGIDTYEAPECIEIKAGVEHQILALEDVTWFCIHATDEKDPDQVDRVVIKDETV
ncbi:MAG: hypothetical protein JKY53_00160 [Flavobacteriales bacterium]|nr:hypothetical protein [Flavobacteriales bacterium]